MPLRPAIETANRVIAAVGGPGLPLSPPETSTCPILSPAAAPSPSLPMMRSAASHTASTAPIISCLPSSTSSSRHSSSAVTPGCCLVQRFGADRCPNCLISRETQGSSHLQAEQRSAYSAEDARRIVGYKSREIEQRLGYRGREEMIHRDDLVLSANEKS